MSFNEIINGLRQQIQQLAGNYQGVRQQQANQIQTGSGGRGISASVGRGGQNRETDARLVQQRLVAHGQNISIDGRVGPQTIAAIERFQQARLGMSDGLVEPNRNTWRALSAAPTTNTQANNTNNNTGNASTTNTAPNNRNTGGNSRDAQLLNSITPPIKGAGPDTAGQDRLQNSGMTGVQISQTMARTDAPNINRYKDLFMRVAREFGLPPAILAALASRETRGRDVIGDHGNGIGIMQIDKRAHPQVTREILSKGEGLPRIEEGIRQGAIILKRNLEEMKRRFPQWTPAQQLKGAIAAYNFGPSNVHTLEGMDKKTTGDDYSSDVWARAMYFMEQEGYVDGATAPANNQNNNQPAPPNRSPQAQNASPSAASSSNIPTTLTASVGRGGQNSEVDVRAVQNRLVRHGIQITVDGRVGPQTIAAIERFQTAKIGSADGRVDPGGNTWRALLGQTVARQAPPTQQNNTNPNNNGSLNQRIATAAQAYRGTSTTAGPDRGNKACAWAVNNVLQRAIGRKFGTNPDLVSSVESALRGQAQSISAAQALPGDIVISSSTSHIGIVVRPGRVLSNSSSNRAFVWESNLNYDGHYGSGSSRIYRING